MAYIEDSDDYRAKEHTRTLQFTNDKKSDIAFRWVYDNGEINCSQKRGFCKHCTINSDEIHTISQQKSSFVYLDVGVWNEYDSQYDFGLVNGPDVYLMEFLPNGTQENILSSKKKSVNDFLEDIKKSGHSYKIINYAHAQNVDNESINDDALYLFLPDYHMPPISWVYAKKEIIYLPSLDSTYHNDGKWPFDSTAFVNSKKDLQIRDLNSYFVLKNLDDSKKSERKPHKADIFGNAGIALKLFLEILINASPITKKRLHIIHVGDMFELWMNRRYQFRSGGQLNKPHFIPNGLKNAEQWILESILMNLDVARAHQKIDEEVKMGNIAESQYIWGNHDSYLMDSAVSDDCGLKRRHRSYRGLNDNLHVEHGHRFDSFNYDNIEQTLFGLRDPWGIQLTNFTYKFPWMRKLESIGRNIIKMITSSLETRDIFVLGASIIYMNEIKQEKKPFNIFVMGHTHIRELSVYNIETKYSLN